MFHKENRIFLDEKNNVRPEKVLNLIFYFLIVLAILGNRINLRRQPEFSFKKLNPTSF
jgi:hypothetical protein